MILYYTVYTCIGFWGLFLGWLHCLSATPLYDHIPVLVTYYAAWADWLVGITNNVYNLK